MSEFAVQNQQKVSTFSGVSKSDLQQPQKYTIKSNGVDKTPDKDTVEVSSKKNTAKKVGIGAAIVAAAIGLYYLCRGKKPPKQVVQQVEQTITHEPPKMQMTEEAKKVYDNVASKLNKKTKTTAETVEKNLAPKQKEGAWDSKDMKEYYTQLEKESAEKAAKEAEVASEASAVVESKVKPKAEAKAEPQPKPTETEVQDTQKTTKSRTKKTKKTKEKTNVNEEELNRIQQEQDERLIRQEQEAENLRRQLQQEQDDLINTAIAAETLSHTSTDVIRTAEQGENATSKIVKNIEKMADEHFGPSTTEVVNGSEKTVDELLESISKSGDDLIAETHLSPEFETFNPTEFETPSFLDDIHTSQFGEDLTSFDTGLDNILPDSFGFEDGLGGFDFGL